MQTTNEQILDRYLRHQTFLIRYAGGLRNEVLPFLADTEADLRNALILWLERVGDNRTLTGASGRRWQADFELELRAIRDPAWDKVSQEIFDQLRSLVFSEAQFAVDVIENATPVILGLDLPPTQELISIVNSQPFEGRTLRQWLDRTKRADVDRLLNAAKIGIVQGRTPSQIARDIVGTRRANHLDGEIRKAFRDVEAVILTIANGIQNEAKQALYAQNSDIIKQELYVATLDARTTLICSSTDGRIFPQGEGLIPPLHFRCRSIRVPIINANNLRNRSFDSRTQRELLTEYAQQNGLERVPRNRDELPFGHKGRFDAFTRGAADRLVGQVPAQTNYNDWLMRQTVEFQNEVLGPTRAAIFRRGEIHLDRFVARNGSTLTLEELQRDGIQLP